MERKLATVQEIKNIRPIEKADAIEVAEILGWQTVVRKGEFKIGDKVIFCEIDSVLPEKPQYEFLKNKKYRIRTIKLRKEISQGICFSLSSLPAGEYEIGQDVTELMGITKYEPPISMTQEDRVPKGNFPSYIVPKTDEIRIQTIPEILNEVKEVPLYISTKIDGTSATFYLKDGVFGACSRNLELKEMENNLYWRIAKKYDLKNKLEDFYQKHNVCLAVQGEIAGQGVNKNPLDLKETKMFVFSIYNITDQEYYGYREFIALAKELELEIVPIEQEDVILGEKTIDQMLEMAKGKYTSGRNKEGIVLRAMLEMYSEVLKGRMSFKVVNNDYLLKEEE